MKFSLFIDQVRYLGHLISVACVSPDPSKLQVLAEWPRPSTVRKMQSFLKFVNFYGDFIADAIELTAPLYDLTASKKVTIRSYYLLDTSNRSKKSNAVSVLLLDLRTPISSTHSQSTLTHRKSMSVRCASSVTRTASTEKYHSSRKICRQRSGIIRLLNESASLSLPIAITTEFIFLVADSASELITDRSHGCSRKNRRRPRASLVG